MIEAVRFKENVFSGEAQISALHKVVLITRVFQDISKADILREKAGNRGRGVAFKRRKQRDPALGGDHSGNRVVGTGELGGVAEVQSLAFQFAELWGQVRERIVIKISALKAFAVNVHQVQFRVGDAF